MALVMVPLCELDYGRKAQEQVDSGHRTRTSEDFASGNMAFRVYAYKLEAMSVEL